MKLKVEKTGFTLIEMLMIISIITVLAGIVSLTFQSGRRKSIQLECMNNLKNLYTMSALYFQDYTALPEYDKLLPLVAGKESGITECPAIRPPLNSEYLAWGPTIDIINHDKNFFSSGKNIFIIDPYAQNHGNYSMAVLNNGKCIQIYFESGTNNKGFSLSMERNSYRPADVSVPSVNMLSNMESFKIFKDIRVDNKGKIFW